MVKFIDGAGAVGAEPEELTDVNGTLYFTAIAYDPNRHASLRELWKSDGTSDGTVKLTDIAPGLFELGGSDLTLDREAASIGSNQLSKSCTAVSVSDCGWSGIVLWLVMA